MTKYLIQYTTTFSLVVEAEDLDAALELADQEPEENFDAEVSGFEVQTCET